MNGELEEVLLSEDLKELIKSIANKFYNVEKKDLYQAGYVGAIKAFNNYIDNDSVKFTTFAYKYIFGEMYELAKNNRNIKLNKTYLKINKRIEQARTLLTQKFNKEPSLEEISLFLEMDIGLINDVYITCKKIMSLDNEYDLDGFNLYDTVGDNIDYIDKMLISDSINTLTNDEKKVIGYRYFGGYTQEEVAKLLGINQVKVSRLEAKSKRKIKEYICA